MAIKIIWKTPEAVQLDDNFKRARIFKSNSEQVGYQQITEIDIKDQNGNVVNSYDDPQGARFQFYIVRFYDSFNNAESDFVLTRFETTPKERRLVEFIQGWIPPNFEITDEHDILVSLNFALNNFNITPPLTAFDIDSFPADYESLLIMGTLIVVCTWKYLRVAIRDFSYTDNGLSLNIDRGAKINTTLQDMYTRYNELLKKAKLNFMRMGVGVGTLQLPLGSGGNIGRGALNILDIFSSLGR
jgi:hypothetical protein